MATLAGRLCTIKAGATALGMSGEVTTDVGSLHR